MNDCEYYWTEKLDANLFSLIFRKVFCDTAHMCLCDRPLLVDMRNTHMRSVQLVCRRWYRMWRVFAVYLVIHNVPFCSNPSKCAEVYALAAPRMPLLRRRTSPLDRKVNERVYKNGRVLVILKSPNAEKPGDGTLKVP